MYLEIIYIWQIKVQTIFRRHTKNDTDYFRIFGLLPKISDSLFQETLNSFLNT